MHVDDRHGVDRSRRARAGHDCSRRDVPLERKVAPIVANAGLYNSFLAAGLIWALFSGSGRPGIGIFFLTCVAAAGVFGAVTLKPTTLLLQTAPAVVALAAVWMAWS
jgi:putative membrane protein